MAEEITDATKRFIMDAFADMDQLRIFLVLSVQRERIFAPGSLVANLNLSMDKVKAGLARLLQIGLIEAITDPDNGFRYAPVSPGLEALAEEVARLDREMPVTLIKLVVSRPTEPIKAFSDAFKIR